MIPPSPGGRVGPGHDRPCGGLSVVCYGGMTGGVVGRLPCRVAACCVGGLLRPWWAASPSPGPGLGCLACAAWAAVWLRAWAWLRGLLRAAIYGLIYGLILGPSGNTQV